MSEENKTKWQQLKELAESGDFEAIKKYKELKKISRIARKESYKKEKSYTPGKRPSSLAKAKRDKGENKERNKIKMNEWKEKNKEYLNQYRKLTAQGFYYNKKVHLQWLKNPDPDSDLLKLDPLDFPIQREEF